MNKIIIIGNLGRDPEMRYSTSGNPMTSFSVATNRRYTTAAGEQREQTEWFNCTAFGRLADTCNQYLARGQQVYVEGRLSTRQYSRQDGSPGFSLDVMITDVQFLGRRDEQQSEGGSYGNEQRGGYDRPVDDRYAGASSGGSGYPAGSRYPGGVSGYPSGGRGSGGAYPSSAPNDNDNMDVDDLPF